MNQGTRTFAALERVHAGELKLAGKGRISASLQARVLTALLRIANGITGEVRKVALSKVAGKYIAEDSVKKACYAMHAQGILLELKQAGEKFTMTIHPFVYDETSAPPTARPAKQKKPRRNDKGATPTSDMRSAHVDNCATPTSDMRDAHVEKGAMPTSDMRDAHAEKGAMPTSCARGSSCLQVDQEVQRRDQERTKRDFEGERLGDPERPLGGSHRSREEQCIREAVERFYTTGDPLQGKHAPLIDILRQASPETIRNLDSSFKAQIPPGVWEGTRLDRSLWERKSTFVPPQPSAHDLY